MSKGIKWALGLIALSIVAQTGLATQRKRGDPWTRSETDKFLVSVASHGEDWEAVGRECSGRSRNQLAAKWHLLQCSQRNRYPWTEEEDTLLLRLVKDIGPKWPSIVKQFSHRTVESIRARFRRLCNSKRLGPVKYDQVDQVDQVDPDSPLNYQTPQEEAAELIAMTEAGREQMMEDDRIAEYAPSPDELRLYRLSRLLIASGTMDPALYPLPDWASKQQE